LDWLFTLGPNVHTSDPRDYFFLGLYASDPTAIEESYEQGDFQISFSVEDLTQEPKDRLAIPLRIGLRDEKLLVQVSINDKQHQESFSSCYMDARWVDYFTTKGFELPDSLIRHQRYHLLKMQPTYFNLYDNMKPQWEMKVYLKNSPPQNTLEVLIFQKETHDFIKALAFDDVAQFQESDSPSHVFSISIEKLQLAPGSYEIFIAADNTVYEKMILDIVNDTEP
jgi:hypothetical protein